MVAGIVLLLSAAALPMHANALGLQLHENDLLTSICGTVGWGNGAS